MSSYRHILFIIAICLLCCSCVPRGIRKAQCVVAQADSLWKEGKQYGVDEGDSATLAQAYERLKPRAQFTIHNSYPQRGTIITQFTNSYAHACYHYGKLLRAKDDPVTAMQVFIDATHSRTRDYHILGRIYSNMGSLCHLASEFSLAYDMYEQSSKMFIQNGDTLAYCYALNDMAFELAEQGKKEEALVLLSRLEDTCMDNVVLTKSWETKARLYLNCAQYDSTLYYAKQLLKEYPCYSSAILLVAQAYSFSGNRDSASLYAKKVLFLSDKLYETTNAWYILTQDDETKDIDGVRMASAQRADSQKLIENYKYKLSQTVQLLEQDLKRKPNLQWLYAMLVTVVIIGICIWIYVFRKRKKKELLAQKIEHLEVAYSDMQADKTIQIEQTCALLRTSTSLQNDLFWKDFEKMCVFVNEHFNLLANKLKQTGKLNDTEIRLCILVLIGLSRSKIANTLPYALNSVGKLKDHTAKSLGTTGKNLHDFLLQMAIEV